MSLPDDLLARTSNFMRCPEPLPEIPLEAPDGKTALDALGPSPFPKRGFPFLGFLSGVYDHVSTTAQGWSK